MKKERYADKDGWVLSQYAYRLNNKCPDCVQPLYAAYQSSPGKTWKRLCGRAGILVYCTHCHADLNFFLAIMNESRWAKFNTKDYWFELFQERSSYTDDSIMTMAVAYWLLKDKEHSYQGLEDIMVMFGEKCPCPMGGYGGGFHTWLFYPEGLYNFDDKYGKAPYESETGRHPYGSWGNGSAMRVSAVGWFFDTLEETERVAAISAAITHNHPEGIKGAQATAAAIWMARNGKTKEEIREYIEKTYGYDLRKTYEYWHPMYHWESGCQGTVPQAIIAFLDSENFEDAIRKAVSLGGDSDTLACISALPENLLQDSRCCSRRNGLW